MELFDFSLAFAGSGFCMHHADSQSCKRKLDLFCNVLCSIIKVADIKYPIAGNGLMKGVFDNRFFLIIIKSGCKQISGMVVNGGRKIGLYPCPVFADGKFRSILDITLDQHHTVRFAETFGRTVSGIFVHLHLFLPITGFIYVAFQRGALQNAGCGISLCLQDVNDLGNRAFRNFPAELERLFQQKIEVGRKPLGTVFFPVRRSEPGELSFGKSFFITIKRPDGNVVFFCDLFTEMKPLCVVQPGLKKR